MGMVAGIGKAMGMVLAIVLVVAALYFILSGNKRGKLQGQGVIPKSLKKLPELSEAEACLALFKEHKSRLSTRWNEAAEQRGAGKLQTFPSWYFDEATQRQTNSLADKGLRLSGLSKGQASDVIGLFFPVEEGDKEVLRFFKVPIKGLNQTTGRAEVAQLQADPEKAAAWDRRPAEPIQKEFYKFFEVKVPRGLTHIAADDYIGKHQQTLDSQQLADWSSYQSILDELLDKDTRDCYYIKKPSIATVRTAIDALRQSGISLSELEEDLEIVTQKLIELQPELER